MRFRKRFTWYKQLNAMDCGPVCLRMISKAYGRHYNTDTLRQMTGFGKEGVSLLGISEAAEKIGFKTRGMKINKEQLPHIPLPAILHWDQNHFVVLVDIKEHEVEIADPGKGLLTFERNKFFKHWCNSKNENGDDMGIALLLEPTQQFYEKEGQERKN